MAIIEVPTHKRDAILRALGIEHSLRVTDFSLNNDSVIEVGLDHEDGNSLMVIADENLPKLEAAEISFRPVPEDTWDEFQTLPGVDEITSGKEFIVMSETLAANEVIIDLTIPASIRAQVEILMASSKIEVLASMDGSIATLQGNLQDPDSQAFQAVKLSIKGDYREVNRLYSSILESIPQENPIAMEVSYIVLRDPDLRLHG